MDKSWEVMFNEIFKNNTIFQFVESFYTKKSIFPNKENVLNAFMHLNYKTLKLLY